MEHPSQNIKSGAKSFFFWLMNISFSILALALVAYLLLARQNTVKTELSYMPAINASLNALSAVLLISARIAIKKKNVTRHKNLMLSAFGSSALFLVGYLSYHYVHGDTHYPKGATLHDFYIALLASHVILSVPVIPLALASFYYASKRDFVTHKMFTKILFPIWLYVSITGVFIFFMLSSVST